MRKLNMPKHDRVEPGEFCHHCYPHGCSGTETKEQIIDSRMLCLTEACWDKAERRQIKQELIDVGVNPNDFPPTPPTAGYMTEQCDRCHRTFTGKEIDEHITELPNNRLLCKVCLAKEQPRILQGTGI
jgi:hypothetical protein